MKTSTTIQEIKLWTSAYPNENFINASLILIYASVNVNVRDETYLFSLAR